MGWIGSAVLAAVALIAMSSLSTVVCQGGRYEATIFYAGPDLPFNMKSGVIDKTGTAWMLWDNTRFDVGWDRLQIETSNSQPEVYQSWAAGYLEGYWTADSIWNVYQNFQFRMLKNAPPAPELVTFINNQLAWTRQMITQHSRNDTYWAQVANLMAQFDGQVAGYAAALGKSKPLGTLEFALFQGSGDLYDIIPAVVPHEMINWSKLQPDVFNQLHHERSSCSALHRLTPDTKEIWAGHTTWTDYGSMVRTYKFYKFAFNTAAKTIAFSAKPALLYSKDDFHVLDSGLTVIETTNGIRDEALYPNVRPNTLLTWQRIPVCNRIATTGEQWTQCFDKYFSGTYANQYQVLDYKRFAPGSRTLQPGTLWINEQVPGYTRSEDVTGVLLRNGGYWPSYNVPYNGFIYNISGFWSAYVKNGDQYSYLKCPRAQIFARDYKKVVDRESMQFIMQYNDYKNDPLSLGDPNNAICARSDKKEGGSAFGAIDGKITSYSDAFKSGLLRAFAISGPTQQQGVFEWTDRYANITHLGEPTKWNFDWQTFDYMNL